MNGIHKAIEKGITFLAKGQEKDGSFFCLVSAKIDDYKNANVVPAIVPTNIVLSSLIHISESDAAKSINPVRSSRAAVLRTHDKVVSATSNGIKQKAAKFLIGEKGEYWSFNYWFRKSDWYKKEPYPDDTDDTFCALAALYEYDPRLFDGEVMAKIVTMLTSAEEKEGGPYDMWLVPPKARNKWRDIDLVCNSNIAYFLSLQDISLPKLDAFIDRSIDEKDYEFPYNKIYPGIYFVSRFYRGKRVKEITRLILSKQGKDGRWENPLRTALAISALINLEGFRHLKKLEKGIDYLIKTQGQNGSWEPYSFYFQMRTKKKTLFAGSPFITTALCLEAIQKFKNQKSKIKITNQNSKLLKKENDVHDAVIQKYKKRFSGFSKNFQEKAIAEALKILTPLEVAAPRSSGLVTKSRARLLTGLKKNKDIVLLPFYFRNALGANGRKVSDDLITQLGVANLFGWIAYTIYDDFLDEEGDPKCLSVANVCLRESAEIFASVLPRETGFAAFSKKIFDIIDDANYWEVTNCRLKFFASRSSIKHSNILQNVRMFYKMAMPNFGDYTQLANKSLGHALGPIAILFALASPQTYADSTRTNAEKKKRDADINHLMRFFRNYIIARQLNDDAHDWEDDLKKGQVNAVGARLLKDARPVVFRRDGTTTEAKSNTRDLETLRQIFWHKTILSVCKDILRYVEFAKKDLKKLSLIKNPEVFAEMLAGIEKSVEKALKEREETMKFLKTYSPAIKSS